MPSIASEQILVLLRFAVKFHMGNIKIIKIYDVSKIILHVKYLCVCVKIFHLLCSVVLIATRKYVKLSFFATFLTDEAEAQRYRQTCEQPQKIQSGRTVPSCIMLPAPQNCLDRKKKW